MFLFWNYTIEAFFWILFVAISIISLTIFLARPKEKSKPLTALETYDGEITETEQYAKKESNLNSSSKKSRPITEEEKFEEFIETLPEGLQAVISMRTYIGILYGLLILGFGFTSLEIGVGVNDQQDFATGNGFFVFFTAIFGSVAFIYGLIQNSYFSTRWGARLMTVYCTFLLISPETTEWGLPSYEALIVLAILGAIGVLYSFNLTQLIGFTAFEKPKTGALLQDWNLIENAARFFLYFLLLVFFVMTFFFLRGVRNQFLNIL